MMTTPLKTIDAELRIYRGQLSSRRGWRMEPGGVSCVFGTRYGNPFECGSLVAEDAIALFRTNLARMAEHPNQWRTWGYYHEKRPECNGRLSLYLGPLIWARIDQPQTVLYCRCSIEHACHCDELGRALSGFLRRP